jgi:HAD superfamily phosphatase (TIGR01668 family)
MSAFRPKEYASSIYELDLSRLKNQGIRGLLVDLDETLIPREINRVSPQAFTWISKAKEVGFKICLTSNSRHPSRVEYLAKTLNVPFIALAMKPFPWAFKRSLDLLDAPPSRVAVIGDQLFTDILGGNWYGMYTVLVNPLTPETFWGRKILRWIEAVVLDYLGESKSA